jgi:hypothetical protein
MSSPDPPRDDLQQLLLEQWWPALIRLLLTGPNFKAELVLAVEHLSNQHVSRSVRERLHLYVDALPPEALPAAEGLLQYWTDPSATAFVEILRTSPVVTPELSPTHREALEQGLREWAAERVWDHREVLEVVGVRHGPTTRARVFWTHTALADLQALEGALPERLSRAVDFLGQVQLGEYEQPLITHVSTEPPTGRFAVGSWGVYFVFDPRPRRLTILRLLPPET